jgi:hypothetical protein
MKTSKKDFEYFRERCLHYIERFKITSWGIRILHGEVLEGAAASCHYHYNGAQAFIRLAQKWTNPITESELDHTARHEVVHLLTGRLYLIGSSRFACEDEIEQANEETVEHLCKLLGD